MIEIATRAKEISSCQTRFSSALKKTCNLRIKCILGYQGKDHDRTSLVHYSEEYGFWYSESRKSNGYWNGFGVGKPSTGRNTDIVVEINVPFRGTYRRLSGAFALDNSGKFLILHRGRVGGGRKGIVKTAFISRFTGDIFSVRDGDMESSVCFVANLPSVFFARQMQEFIFSVSDFKTRSGYSIVNIPGLRNISFFEEPTGKYTRPSISAKSVELTHGIIVNELRRVLGSRDFKVGNDKNRDIFIYRKKEVKVLFEIKSDLSTQDLYKGVGQLLIYGIPFDPPARLVLVLPERLKPEVTGKLLNHQIEILYFRWIKDLPIFLELDTFTRTIR
jgi:hypothetical protein